MNRINYLLKNTLLIFMGNLGSKLITFLLIPLYTAVLTTEQYGTVDLIFNIMMIALPIITLNIYESLLRFSLDKGADLYGVLSVGLCALFILIALGAVLSLVLYLYEPLSPYSLHIFFYAVTMGTSQMLMYYLKGRELLLLNSIGSILQTFLIAVFIVILLVVYGRGVKGYLEAFSLSYLVTSIYCIVVSRSYLVFKKFHIDIRLAKEMIKYSVVLIPGSFTWWVMSSSDKLMVVGILGVSANAIYAISYKLPTLVYILTGIFNQAWGYSAIREHGAQDETEYNNLILKKMSYFSVFVALVIITFSKFFLRYYVSFSFYESWKYIPSLVIGQVFVALSGFIATSYMIHKDSWGVLFSSMGGAIVNIVLNLLLIPLWGLHGAAFATCSGFFFMCLFRLFGTRKYMRYRMFSGEFIIGCMFMIISSFLSYYDGHMGFVIQVLILLLFAIIGKNFWSSITASILRRASTCNHS